MTLLRRISERRYSFIEMVGFAAAYGAISTGSVGVLGFFGIIIGADLASAAIYKFSKAGIA